MALAERRQELEVEPSSIISEAEIERRKELLELGADDFRRLREVAPHLTGAMPEIVARTYLQDVMKFEEPAGLLKRVVDEGRLEAVAKKLTVAFQQQLEADLDQAYAKRRAEIGQVHARIGLEPQWYLGALNLVQQRLAETLEKDPVYGKDPGRAFAAMRSLAKVVYFDMMVVLDAYVEHSLGRTIRSQEDALRELSAPVVEVWEEILVVPLIGAMDTRRAQEVTESILTGVVEKRAKVIIIDITGLPVMDTSTANHLFRTVRAVELLGASAIITGVRPAIAQTVVSLGIDTTVLKTKARLVDGLRLALELTGQRVSTESTAAPQPNAAAPAKAAG